MEVDYNVGQILEAIKKVGMEENTIVIPAFLSANQMASLRFDWLTERANGSSTQTETSKSTDELPNCFMRMTGVRRCFTPR